MNMKDLQTSARQAAELMKALSSENRLLLLCQLADGEKTVGELADSLNLRQAAVSQQLALLRKDGLVAPRRDGQTIYYSLARGDISELMRFLHKTYCPADRA